MRSNETKPKKSQRIRTRLTARRRLGLISLPLLPRNVGSLTKDVVHLLFSQSKLREGGQSAHSKVLPFWFLDVWTDDLPRVGADACGHRMLPLESRLIAARAPASASEAVPPEIVISGSKRTSRLSRRTVG